MTIRREKDTQGVREQTTGCRVEDIGLNGFAECLDVGPKACPYAMPFGYAFLCQHPKLEELIARTRQQKVSLSTGC